MNPAPPPAAPPSAAPGAPARPPVSALPPAPPQAAAPLDAPALAAAPRAAGVPPGLLAAWAAADVANAMSALLWQKLSHMQHQLARQSAQAGTQAVEARTLAREARDTARDTAARLAVIDNSLGDLSAYRTQLEELLQSATRSHDENLAVDLEAAMRLAQEQSQLTGSVAPLLAALRTAEHRLARGADPRLAPVARAVQRDLERVRSASLPDVAGLLARIDQLLKQVDSLPAANDVGAPLASRQVGDTPGDAAAPPAAWWQRAWRTVAHEAARLVRVSRIDKPEASMLSPEQVFFVRENLKLRLQGARLALLARQYEAARADLASAAYTLGTLFDPASRRTQAAATLLQQIQAQTRAAELPRADQTLTALAAAASRAGSSEGR